MRIKPLWYYSKHWECEYSLTWRLRTHESIKITTGIFYVGIVGMLLQGEWLCSVHRRGLAQTGAGTATDSAWVSTWQEEAEQPWPSQPTWISGGEIPVINTSPGECIPPQVRVPGEKSAHSEDTRGLYWQVVPLGITQAGKEQVWLESSGRISVDVAGLLPLRTGQQGEVLCQPAQEEQLQLPHTTVQSKA